jgi:hypothetical protein
MVNHMKKQRNISDSKTIIDKQMEIICYVVVSDNGNLI